MTSDFYFIATSLFPENVLVKPHSKHSAPPPDGPLKIDLQRTSQMISQKALNGDSQSDSPWNLPEEGPLTDTNGPPHPPNTLPAK